MLIGSALLIKGLTSKVCNVLHSTLCIMLRSHRSGGSFVQVPKQTQISYYTAYIHCVHPSCSPYISNTNATLTEINLQQYTHTLLHAFTIILSSYYYDKHALVSVLYTMEMSCIINLSHDVT